MTNMKYNLMVQCIRTQLGQYHHRENNYRFDVVQIYFFELILNCSNDCNSMRINFFELI